MIHTPTSLDFAIQVAAKAHAGQRRKYTGEPYLVHPLEVVSILLRHGVEDQDMICAAVLHDVLEDCGWDSGELFEQLNFASTKYDWIPVIGLVAELTEPDHQACGDRMTLALKHGPLQPMQAPRRSFWQRVMGRG